MRGPSPSFLIQDFNFLSSFDMTKVVLIFKTLMHNTLAQFLML